MPYDPFPRGAAPVGVRSLELVDAARAGRRLALEVWYPAAAEHAGRDLDDATCDRFEIAPGLPAAAQRAVRGAAPAAGRFPLVAYFHGATGHRREATELTTHLASHGYVVASPDFTGNTMADLFADLASGGAGAPRLAPMDRSAVDRPLDAKLVLDRMQGGGSDVDPALAALVDPARVGACGISFGGWTTLALNSIDRRPRASFPIVPAWGKGPVKTETLQALVRLDDWGRPVPTFVLAAERDALILLESLRELHRELPPPKRLAVLRNAGHLHFADNAEQGHEMLRAMWKSGSFPAAPGDIDLAAIAEAARPFAELCPAAHGAATVQGLCLAHMDAHVKGVPEAGAFLAGDLRRVFAARGIELEVV
jgi:predicted dienelactone hydrolase